MNYIIYTYIKGRNYRPTSRRNFGCLDFNVFKGLIRCFILGITVCVYRIDTSKCAALARMECIRARATSMCTRVTYGTDYT